MKDNIGSDIALPSHIEILSNTGKIRAQQIIDYIYNLDAFERIQKLIDISNEKTIKIKTDELGGNYLSCIFTKPNSDVYDKSEGKKKSFLRKSLCYKEKWNIRKL